MALRLRFTHGHRLVLQKRFIIRSGQDGELAFQVLELQVVRLFAAEREG
jgi:hypothetical protein